MLKVGWPLAKGSFTKKSCIRMILGCLAVPRPVDVTSQSDSSVRLVQSVGDILTSVDSLQ